MALTGHCYCGELHYEADGDPAFRAQCHCPGCQYISGGHPNAVMGMLEDGFRYTKGTPAAFSRSDLDNAVTREFCGTCGTHILAKSPGAPGMLMLKAGTLDDQSAYGGPQMAIFTCDNPGYHHIPDGVAAFDKTPG